MFLRPHQLQAAQRFATASARDGDKTDHYYNWGLRSVKLNLEALANQRFEVHSLQARFRDGTLVTMPDEATLPPCDLRGAFEKERVVTVYLGLPVYHQGRPNVSPAGQAQAGRFQAVEHEIEDENTGINPQPVPVLVPNFRLLLSTDNRDGYEVLELARVEKIGQSGSLPRIDASYFPPVLSTAAWPDLRALIEKVYDVVGSKIDPLAKHLLASNVPIESAAVEDTRVVGPLRTLNEAYALLHVLAFAEGVHPLTTYSELCRLVGRLSIYGPKRRPPDLPRYDHDDLGRCFNQVFHHLYGLLNIIQPPAYEKLPFVGAGRILEVRPIRQEWLLPAHQLFVGVWSEVLGHDEVENRLTGTGPAALSMKIASSDKVEQIFDHRRTGLEFRRVDNPPRVLPASEKMTYFQVVREAQEAEWANVGSSGTLALRISDAQIAEPIHGQTTLRIYRSATAARPAPGTGPRAPASPGTADLAFWLFVV
jgi:type VI secretion system protein ImpJ